MMKRHSRLPRSIILAVFILAVFSSCPVDPPDMNDPGSGAAMVRLKQYIYLIGGRRADGTALSSVQYAEVDSSGSIGDWKDTVPLKEARAFSSVFAADSWLYVVGGESGSKVLASIERATINTDGSIASWTSSRDSIGGGRPLPKGGRSRAAGVAHDGRLFLIGGKTSEGYTDTIIHLRLNPGDRQLGAWFLSPARLPSARCNVAAAAGEDTLYVAGGRDSAGLLDEVISYDFGATGLLSNRAQLAPLPDPAQSVGLFADADGLRAFGGYGSTAALNRILTLGTGGWTAVAGSLVAEGPSFVQSGGSLRYIDADTGEAGTSAVFPSSLESPAIVPGSGYTSSRTLAINTEPGAFMRYREDGGTVGIADPVWDGTAKLKFDQDYSFRSYLGSRSSAQSRLRFSSLVLPSFIVSDGTLPIQASPGTDEPKTMEADAAEAWYDVIIEEFGMYTLRCVDSTLSSAYTATVSVWLLDNSLSGNNYIEVPDSDGLGVGGRDAGTIGLTLFPGKYVLRVREKSNQKGGSFGLSLVRE